MLEKLILQRKIKGKIYKVKKRYYYGPQETSF